MDAQEWQEEIDYCINLVKAGGDDNVGHKKQTILSYLTLQMGSATDQGYRNTALTLYGLIVRVKAGRHPKLADAVQFVFAETIGMLQRENMALRTTIGRLLPDCPYCTGLPQTCTCDQVEREEELR